jgi:uncharacterized protein with GYD domain
MGYYVMMSKLTDHGAKTIKENPGRILEVDDEMAAMGVKILCQYVLFGVYDFMTVLEAPDEATVARASVELGSRGSIKVATFPAMTVNDFISAIG